MNEIFVFAKSTQEQEIKSKRQLNDIPDSVKFISDKFKEYEEDWAKQIEIIGNLQSEVRVLSSKLSKLEKHANHLEWFSRRNCLFVQGIKEVKDEATDDVTIERYAYISIKAAWRKNTSNYSQVCSIQYNDRNKKFRKT